MKNNQSSDKHKQLKI